MRRALLAALIGASLLAFLVAPVTSAASSRRADGTSTQSCMKSAATRPQAMTARVAGSGRHQTVVIAAKVGAMSAGCRRLGTRTMTSYGIRSDAGAITRITARHTFAKPAAHGNIVARQAVLRTQRLTCKAGAVTAFSAHFVAARIVERWTASKSGASSSSTFEVVDTKALCERG